MRQEQGQSSLSLEEEYLSSIEHPTFPLQTSGVSALYIYISPDWIMHMACGVLDMFAALTLFSE